MFHLPGELEHHPGLVPGTEKHVLPLQLDSDGAEDELNAPLAVRGGTRGVAALSIYSV